VAVGRQEVFRAVGLLVSLSVLLPAAARAQAFEKELAKQTADAHSGDAVGFEVA
jgi:hypothetical protein